MKRPWLLPLNPLYAAGVAWKNRGFDAHPERAKKLRDPVISVGSLSAGGAGKTPFVIALGNALRGASVGIDVLSRGHGRSGEETLRVNPTGDASEFGDEPLLLAQRLACPVYVAPRRYDAGVRAERDRRHAREDKNFSVHLLDDGFQHRQLARAVDIVLLTAEDVRDALLPAGNLREPLRLLRRADVVVLREEEAAELQPVLERVFAGRAMPLVWTVRRRFAFVEGTPSKFPFAFCGIARPGSFRSELEGAGVNLAQFHPLRDHARYRMEDVKRLAARAVTVGADGFVTTAKDAVKLTPRLRAELNKVAPLALADVAVQLQDAPRRVGELKRLIEAWWGRQ